MSVDVKNVLENQVVTLLDRLKECPCEYVESVSKEISRLIPALETLETISEKESSLQGKSGFEKMKWAKEFIESRHDDIRVGSNSMNELTIWQDEDARVFLNINIEEDVHGNYEIQFNIRNVNYSNIWADELYSIIETYQHMADTLKELEKETIILTKNEMKEWRQYLNENSKSYT